MHSIEAPDERHQKSDSIHRSGPPRAACGAGHRQTGGCVPRDVYKTGGRHAAITNSLYNWHSYKNWAEKARGAWDEKK